MSERRLGLGSASALVVAGMIGTGVFTTSGVLLARLGSVWAVLAAWAFGGLVAALGAISYGALARRIPESGGEYVFLSRTLHPAVGYLAGWLTLLAGFAAPSAAGAIAFAAYVQPFLPARWPAGATATALLLVVAALHAGPLPRAARVQQVAVAVEVLLILVFLAGGASHLHAPAAQVVLPGPGTFALGLVWVSYSYAGWNTAIYVGGEVRQPERNLPRAMLLGTLLVTGLYLALNAVFLLAVPHEKLVGQIDVGRLAAEAIGGPRLAAAVSALVALVLATFVSSLNMAGPHISARMAADGYLPRRLAARPGQPPRAALLLQVAIALLLIWTAAYDRILTYVGFALGLSTAATVAGLMRLRLREGAALPVWGWPWVPSLFLAFVLGTSVLAVVQRPLESAAGLALLLLGLLAFRLRGAGRK